MNGVATTSATAPPIHSPHDVSSNMPPQAFPPISKPAHFQRPQQLGQFQSSTLPPLPQAKATEPTPKPSTPPRIGPYDVEKTIGKGNHAVVKKARHKVTKTEVAIKIIDKRRLDPENVKKIEREVKVLQRIKHPNIIKLYQVIDTPSILYLITEYAPNGEIYDMVHNNKRLSEDEARHKFWQIISAVEYLHKNGIVHRDLKAENLLLDSNHDIKLADFGFSNFYEKENTLDTFCGSPPYAAPEIFEGKRYTGPEIDVWSLGVVLYVLVSGVLPFEGINLQALRDRVLSGRIRIPFFMSTECEQLIRRMLTINPAKRPTLEQIKRHRWMKADEFEARSTTSNKFMSIDTKEPHPQVMKIIQNMGLNMETVENSLKTEAYDNYHGVYLLLLERLRESSLKLHQLQMYEQQKQKKLYECGGRRRQSDAPGQVRPLLKGLREHSTFQTTDCTDPYATGYVVNTENDTTGYVGCTDSETTGYVPSNESYTTGYVGGNEGETTRYVVSTDTNTNEYVRTVPQVSAATATECSNYTNTKDSGYAYSATTSTDGVTVGGHGTTKPYKPTEGYDQVIKEGVEAEICSNPQGKTYSNVKPESYGTSDATSYCNEASDGDYSTPKASESQNLNSAEATVSPTSYNKDSDQHTVSEMTSDGRKDELASSAPHSENSMNYICYSNHTAPESTTKATTDKTSIMPQYHLTKSTVAHTTVHQTSTATVQQSVTSSGHGTSEETDRCSTLSRQSTIGTIGSIDEGVESDMNGSSQSRTTFSSRELDHEGSGNSLLTFDATSVDNPELMSSLSLNSCPSNGEASQNLRNLPPCCAKAITDAKESQNPATAANSTETSPCTSPRHRCFGEGWRASDNAMFDSLTQPFPTGELGGKSKALADVSKPTTSHLADKMRKMRLTGPANVAGIAIGGGPKMTAAVHHHHHRHVMLGGVPKRISLPENLEFQPQMLLNLKQAIHVEKQLGAEKTDTPKVLKVRMAQQQQKRLTKARMQMFRQQSYQKQAAMPGPSLMSRLSEEPPSSAPLSPIEDLKQEDAMDTS
ncbi:unnamed protein product [Bursaphelenchus okinawaensis]|uniref:non-specific serine/threonine protein kinase n=1 Tax=Bursaphelenchus okinawaensis TaxID=465554 RepID=A0A811KCT6_9BILA|nr:unnamed protein product [Bursaphelenchus okinawaensis]CAG9101849.1 unnamed protein product [Bursaphelenchus okinawaensis]